MKPWFNRPPTQKPTHIAIIGAGIAGCACAYGLRALGVPITLFDQHPRCAGGASGNPAGLIEAAYSVDHNPVDRFYEAALQQTLATLQVLQASAEPPEFQLTGLLRIMVSPERQAHWQRLLERRQLPVSLFHWLTPAEVSARLGWSCAFPAVWVAEAGVVSPQQLCRSLLAAVPQLTTHYATAIVDIEQKDQHWQLLTAAGESHTFSHVIIAGGDRVGQLSLTQDYPLRLVPGQITQVPATLDSARLALPLSFDDGYLLPAVAGQHVVGASFRPVATATDICERDHQRNWAQLLQAVPELAAVWSAPTWSGRVAVRATSFDHLPLVGPIADKAVVTRAYAKLSHGGTIQRCHYPAAQYQPNAFLCTGLGSRGLTSALLAAELLAALIGGGPLPLGEDLYHAVHPSRFWVRALQRAVQ